MVNVGLQSLDDPVGVHRRAQFVDLVAGVIGGNEVLPAVLHPLDGAPEPKRS